MAAGDLRTRTSNHPTPTKLTPTTATGGRPRQGPTRPSMPRIALPCTAPLTPPPATGAPRTERATQTEATGPPRPGTSTSPLPTAGRGPLARTEAPSGDPIGTQGAPTESNATPITGDITVPGRGRAITQLTALSAGAETENTPISTMKSTGPLALRGNPGSFQGETPIQRGTKERPPCGLGEGLKGRSD